MNEHDPAGSPAKPDVRGASLVEYALLVALIAMVCFAAVTLLGGSTDRSFSDAGSRLEGS